jgi:GT2 family glycosyltransferase
MNEYISHGVNGLLYDPHQGRPVDFSAARAIGARARESMERGHQRWLTSIPALLDFVATPAAQLRERAGSSIPVRNQYAQKREPGPPGRPLVSVVTVCRNAAAVLEATLDSVASQTGCDFEHVVLDGVSSDNSVEIIKRHTDRIAIWRSSKDDGPYDAMNASLAIARGEWVLFMNAGDTFSSEDALRRMFTHAPDDAGVIYGHHLYRLEDGTDELHHAAEFETTWSRLRNGDLWFDWLPGIPGHQATAVRRDLLTRLRFDTRYRIAADHDLLFRARAEGARFFNCDEIIAIYAAGGLSSRNYGLCMKEWTEIAQMHGGSGAAASLKALLGKVNAPPGRFTRIGRLLLRIMTMLERHSPALAQTARRIVRTPTVRRLLRGLSHRRRATQMTAALPQSNSISHR